MYSVTQIESAFNNGSGHYFMQKNNFTEIIAISEFEIEENENKGFSFFCLDSIERNPIKGTQESVKSDLKYNWTETIPYHNWWNEEMPDAGNL